MKALSLLALVLVSSLGCSALAWKDPSSPTQLSKIKNHQRCHSDMDCLEGDRCGFVDVDTFAVCLADKAEWTGVPGHPTF